MKKGQKCTEEAREHYKAAFAKRNYWGPNNPNWRGGRLDHRRDGRVVVYAPENPNSNLYGGTHILEYRLLVEKKIGRYLRSDEIVHHIDRDTTNNSPDNLSVMTLSEHAREHAKGRQDPVSGRFMKVNQCAQF